MPGASADAQKSLAGIALMRGDHARARRLFDESLDHPPKPGRRSRASRTLSPTSRFSRSRRVTPRRSRDLALRGPRDRTRERPSPLARERARDVGEARRRRTDEPALAHSAVRPCRTAPRDRREPGCTTSSDGPIPTPTLGALRSRVGEATFEEEWERGRAMTLLEAIDQASGEEHEHAPGTP